MASGLYSQLAIAPDVDTLAYTTAHDVSLTIRILNKSDNQIRVNIAIASGATPLDAEYIEYKCPIDPYSVLEISSLVLTAGKNIIIRSTQPGAISTIYGTAL